MIFTADLDGEWYDVYADKQLFAFSAVLPSLSLVARDTLPNNHHVLSTVTGSSDLRFQGLY